MNTCTRCKGHGSLDIYAHVCKGVCFKCEGKGYVTPERRTVLAGERAAKIAFNKRNAQAEAILETGPVEYRKAVACKAGTWPRSTAILRMLETYLDRVEFFAGTEPEDSELNWAQLADTFNLPRLTT